MKISDYNEIVSLGSNCNIGLSLRELNLKKEAYPFDWVRTNAKIIYDVLTNKSNLYAQLNNAIVSNDYFLSNLHYFLHPHFPNTHVNYYGQHFTHHLDHTPKQLTDRINRQLNRFHSLLQTNKKILFIHCNEEYIYHEHSRNHRMELYHYLCKINDHFLMEYPDITFDIINIDIFDDYTDYKNIKNIKLNYNQQLSERGETHNKKGYTPYRDGVTQIIKSFL